MIKSMPVTSSLQDYLEVILNLSEGKKVVRVTDIADRLSIAKPSVIQALTLLKDKGLIRQNRYGPVELTDEGYRHAEKVWHRHNVLYGFLTGVLGVTPQAAEEDACLMEHDLSSETFEKLIAFLKEQNIEADYKKRKRGEARSRATGNGGRKQ